MSRDEKLLIVLVLAVLIIVASIGYFTLLSYPEMEYCPGYMMKEGW